MSEDDCLSPIGLDCCSCCLDLANGIDDSMGGRGSPSQGLGALPGSPTSPTVSHFRQFRHQLRYQNVNTDKLNNIMRQDSLESVVRDPCFLLNEGICNSNIDQTMLSILLYFHSTGTMRGKSTVSQRIVKMGQRQARYLDAPQVNFGSPRTLCPHHLEQPGPRFCCHYQHYPQVYPERVLSYSPPYSPSLFKRPPERRASGASVVAIDNKIEQAMDLVKNHLMYAVREEVEILKEQIKELAEKNNQLERENHLLKNLASPEQLEKFQSRIPTDVPLDNQSLQANTERKQLQMCGSGSAV